MLEKVEKMAFSRTTLQRFTVDFAVLYRLSAKGSVTRLTVFTSIFRVYNI